MNPHFQRGSLLYRQSRYQLALEEFQKALAIHPNEGRIHAFIALCLMNLQDHPGAKAAAAAAIPLEPDSAFLYYVAALVALHGNEVKEAETLLQTAIEIQPLAVEHYSLLAQIHMQRRDWQKCLDACDQGLAIEPDDADCLNFRTMALMKLGRKDLAQLNVESTLEQHPEDAWSHAQHGWVLIEREQFEQALPHFQEALRLEPNLEWAREGIVTCLKGAYYPYRLILRWFLFCGKLKAQYLWIIIIGGFFLFRSGVAIAKGIPILNPLVPVIIGAYLIFALSTWIADPLTNVFLLFSRYGRLALSDQEKRSTYAVCGGLAGAGILFLAGYFLDNFGITAVSLASLMFALLASSYYDSDAGWPRVAHRFLLAGPVILGTSALVLAALIQWGDFVTHKAADLTMAKQFRMWFYILLGLEFASMYLNFARPRKGTSAERQTLLGGWAAVVLGTMLLAGSLFQQYQYFAEGATGLMTVRVHHLLDEAPEFPGNTEAIEELLQRGFERGEYYVTTAIDLFAIELMLKPGSPIIAIIDHAKDSQRVILAFRTARNTYHFVANQSTEFSLPDGWSFAVNDAGVESMLAEIASHAAVAEGAAVTRENSESWIVEYGKIWMQDLLRRDLFTEENAKSLAIKHQVLKELDRSFAKNFLSNIRQLKEKNSGQPSMTEDE